MVQSDGDVREGKLNDLFTDKLADDVSSERTIAHRDQRPEISLLNLFSYDRLCTPAREKGWV